MIGNKDASTCPLMHILAVLSGKWKASIIWYLGTSTQKVLRYGELRQAMPYKISHKVFIEQVGELERDGIIDRKEYDEMPPRVEYSLTPMGRALLQVLFALRDWSVLYGDYDASFLARSQGRIDETGITYGDEGDTAAGHLCVTLKSDDENAQAKIKEHLGL